MTQKRSFANTLPTVTRNRSAAFGGEKGAEFETMGVFFFFFKSVNSDPGSVSVLRLAAEECEAGRGQLIQSQAEREPRGRSGAVMVTGRERRCGSLSS